LRAATATVSEQNWGVQLKDSRIYEILHCLGLSHQRGHRDYANADATAQQQWTQKIKKLQLRQANEKIVFFDEFAVYDRPSGF